MGILEKWQYLYENITLKVVLKKNAERVLYDKCVKRLINVSILQIFVF